MVELQASAYYYEIQKCNDLSKINAILPNRMIKGFESIMEIIIEKLEEDLESLYELWEEKTSDEKEVVEEIEKIKIKISFCENHLYPKDKKDNHIIFATSTAGQILPLSDIAGINKEYHGAILELLSKLQEEMRTNNPKKQKVITNNKTMKGVKEVKDNKVRILYKSLKGNAVYVFLIMIKKDDWSKRDDNKVDIRLKNTQNDYEYFENLEEELLIKELSERQSVYEDILSVLIPEEKKENNNLKKEDILIPQKLAVKEELKNIKAPTQISKKVRTPRHDKTPEFKKLDKEWKFYYKIAIKVKRLEGTINVKTIYCYNDIKFGKWIKAQKDAYDIGLLSPYQIKLLNDLGIVWHKKNKEEVEVLTLEPSKSKVIKTNKRLAQLPTVKSKLKLKWEQKYLLAQQFYQKNGHLKVPQIYTVDGVNLGTWINTQRQKYKKGTLSKESIEKLENIGMLWEIYNKKEPSKKQVINETLTNIYQNLYNMSKEEANEFILKLENDSEGLSKISGRQK